MFLMKRTVCKGCGSTSIYSLHATTTCPQHHRMMPASVCEPWVRTLDGSSVMIRSIWILLLPCRQESVFLKRSKQCCPTISGAWLAHVKVFSCEDGSKYVTHWQSTNSMPSDDASQLILTLQTKIVVIMTESSILPILINCKFIAMTST
jgi:hypothetical protein